LAQFSGTWEQHGGTLYVDAAGRFLIRYRTYAWCSSAPPPCDAVNRNVILMGGRSSGLLTRSVNGIATGQITQTNDSAVYGVGPVRMTLDVRDDSLAVTPSYGNGAPFPFCGAHAPILRCGA
jgi:hypothetical protein